jgi:hypothetical protein
MQWKTDCFQCVPSVFWVDGSLLFQEMYTSGFSLIKASSVLCLRDH